MFIQSKEGSVRLYDTSLMKKEAFNTYFKSFLNPEEDCLKSEHVD